MERMTLTVYEEGDLWEPTVWKDYTFFSLTYEQVILVRFSVDRPQQIYLSYDTEVRLSSWPHDQPANAPLVKKRTQATRLNTSYSFDPLPGSEEK